MEEGTYRLPRTPSSSAVDFTRSPTGLASSATGSPRPEGENTVTRRRTSWGRVDPGQDPLQLELPKFQHTFPRMSRNTNSTGTYADPDDPFFSPVDDLARSREFSFANVNTAYDSDPDSIYSAPQAGPSNISLTRGLRNGNREDDQAHLTSNMAINGMADAWGDGDYERAAANPSRSRRGQIDIPSSPLKRTGTALKNVTRRIKRASLRVVNVGGSGLESQIRLGDDETAADKDAGREWDDSSDSTRENPVRGRALGFLGPSSWLRRACFHLLMHPYVSGILSLLPPHDI